MIPYKLIRSNRRSIALIVEADGGLTVRAPLRLPQAAIEAFIQEKSAWIVEKQANARAQSELSGRPPGGARRFEPGEKMLYLGQPYTLELVDRQAQHLTFAQGFRLLKSAQPRAAQVFEAWYKAQARQYFTRRAGELARQHGFTYSSLRLSSARTRWGSCSARGTISLTWRLIMAPPAVIDYVILHELAHLKQRNHSARFWTLVETLDPEYRPHRSWLKQNGESLYWP